MMSEVVGAVLETDMVITAAAHSALYDRLATTNGAGAVPLATVCPLGSPSRTRTVYRPGGNAAPARHSQYTVSDWSGRSLKPPCVAVGPGPPPRGRGSKVAVYGPSFGLAVENVAAIVAVSRGLSRRGVTPTAMVTGALARERGVWVVSLVADTTVMARSAVSAKG